MRLLWLRVCKRFATVPAAVTTIQSMPSGIPSPPALAAIGPAVAAPATASNLAAIGPAVTAPATRRSTHALCGKPQRDARSNQ